MLSSTYLRTMDASTATHYLLPSYPECLLADLRMPPPRYQVRPTVEDFRV
jgi:hypothetical protein